VALLAGLALTAVACSSHRGSAGEQVADDAGDDGGADSAPVEAGAADGDDAATSSTAYVRIAQLSPDTPSIDVCVAAHGTGSFQGPLLAQLGAANAGDAGDEAEAGAAEEDAGPPGVAYAQVSAYLPLEPGAYDVRIVPAGSSSCAAFADAGVPDTTDLPAMALGAHATLLVAGELTPAGSDPGITVALLPDDTVLAGGACSLRAINAMPAEPSLDFGLGSGSAWLPLFTDVRFAAASAHAGPGDSALDAQGYVAVAPFAPMQAMSARASGSDAGADLAVATSVTLSLGSIATVVAIGGKAGDTVHPPSLLLCTDNQPSGGLLADCSIAQ
jgi:hypothetical protein